MVVFNPFPTLKREMTLKTVIVVFLIAFFYISLSLYTLNYRFVIETLQKQFPLQYKLNVFVDMLLGIGSVFPWYELLLLSMSALLVGITVSLLLKEMRKLRRQGSMKLSLGSVLVSGVGIGCPSCGITILSVLGPSSSIVLLPYQTMALQFLALFLLIVSLYFLLKNINAVCYIKPFRR